MFMVRALERLGGKVIEQDEPDIGAAFLKFSVVTKELSALMKTLVSSRKSNQSEPKFIIPVYSSLSDAKHKQHCHVSG